MTARHLALASVTGLVLGCLCGLPIHLPLRSLWFRVEERRRPEDVTLVWVAARDLPAGATLTQDDLYGVQFPSRFAPDGVLTGDPDRQVGRRLLPCLADEPLREERLEPVSRSRQAR